MKATGVDSLESWRTAVWLGVMYLFATSSMRVMGIIFVGLIEDFDLSREEAAWPLTIQSICIQAAAPIATILCRRWSHEWVLRNSHLVSCAAIALCYFTPTCIGISLLFGFLHGSALSGVFVAGNVIQAEHFDKKRVSAQGLTATIASLSMFIAPDAYRWALDEYRIMGSLLLLGAASLNGYAISLAISKPPEKNQEISEELAKTIIEESCIATRPNSASRSLPRSRVSSIHSVVDDFSPPVACVRVKADVAEGIPDIVVQDPEGRKSVVTLPDLPSPPRKGFGAWLAAKSGYYLGFTFLTDVVSFSLIFQGLSTFMMLVVDYIEGLEDVTFDKGRISTLTFSAFCAGDLLLRSTAGVFIDAQLISTNAMMAIGFWLQGIAFVIFVLVRSSWAILLMCFVLGTSNGSRIFLFPIVLIADFGLVNLTECMGVGSFVNGIVSLWRPLLVGYFRDTHGDYTGLFLLMGALNIPFALHWTARWILRK